MLPEPVALEARPRRSVASRVRRSHRGRPAELHPRALAGRPARQRSMRHRRPRRWAALRRPGADPRVGPEAAIVGRQHGMHTRHGEGAAGIDADDARVRSRAEHQLREQHPVGAKVLGVAGAAGDFGQQVLCRVVLANQLEPVRVDRREAGCGTGCGRCARCAGRAGCRCARCGCAGCGRLWCWSAITPSSRALRRSSCSRGSCCSPRTGTDCRRCRAPSSARVGLGFVLRKPVVAMMNPVMQKAHWKPWPSSTACWTGLSVPSGAASPSTVCTSAPHAVREDRAGVVRHVVDEHGARPHSGPSQPIFVPVSPSLYAG